MEIAEAIGFAQFWGFTPSMPLLSNEPGDYNIFISGNGDIRHVLRTLSEECLNDEEKSLTFYIHESSKEVLARDLLFIIIVNDLSLSIRERVELFLEIYGNALIRERAAEYIHTNAQKLIKIITQHREAGLIQNIFDLSGLKFKERDELEETFRS